MSTRPAKPVALASPRSYGRLTIGADTPIRTDDGFDALPHAGQPLTLCRDQISSGREVDRIDAMKVFIAALDEGGLRKAGRKLGRSPAAISRALGFLEAHVGVTLLHRTTRSFKLSEAGERYAIVCRRVISDLEEADLVAAGERSAPRGTLTLTAPVAAGEDVLRSILD